MFKTQSKETAFLLALSLCGVGTRENEYITLDWNPVQLWDRTTEAEGERVHETPNLITWFEFDQVSSTSDILPVRWGYISRSYRVTECSGGWPALEQKVLEFGRQVMPADKPEPHHVENTYSHSRFNWYDGAG